MPDESISMAGVSACPTSVTAVTVKETSVKLKLMAINPLSLFVYTCKKIPKIKNDKLTTITLKSGWITCSRCLTLF